MLDYENLKSGSLTSSERGAALAATSENANQELRVLAVMRLVDALDAARTELEQAQEERDALLDAMRDALACCRDADYTLAATVLGNAIRAVGERVE